ncbi:MAG: DUF167 domain-containing protein [Candidatus Bathyarchaeia archaeon]|jgi:uncharacterized protein (TIGR00251 family)|nr:YggU family protein [Candidatus Bathyarchaeota archaeon A05DMB-4]MDH7594839.1 DUF167 domain-containing protein [Candidatus Bathyarchaeota archaeon]
MNLTQTPEGTIIKITVKPKSKKFEIKSDEETLVIFCQNVPEKGKVNRELTKELSKLLKRQVEIVSGFSSREKIILVRNTKKEEIEAALRSL